MLQALIKRGKVLAENVPSPMVSEGSVLIKVIYSCISAGTEMTGVQTSGKSLIRQALEQPENVKKALNMIGSEGLKNTMRFTLGKLEAGLPTGYSISGVVIDVGKDIVDFKPGDRVAAAGAGIANHAEFVDVPRNLVMRIPSQLDFKVASTVALGGIAMQGVRRARIQLGEFVVVFGVGILGLIATQLVKAAGGRCIAVDLGQKRLELAEQLGAELTIHSTSDEDPVAKVLHFTGGYGADAVLFTAATSQSAALSQAFDMTRKKGRLVMVGVYGKELHRRDIYQKELDFLISTSYGPGRYDENYEQKGLDYPYAYVRWTGNRNMDEYLRLLATEVVDVEPMIYAVYPIKRVTEAFESFNQLEHPLLVFLHYGEPPEDIGTLHHKPRRLELSSPRSLPANKPIRVGLIGAGDFAKAVHLPNLQKLHDKYKLVAVCNRTGTTARQVAQNFGAQYATTDYQEVLADPEIDLVMICTRHNLHGQMVLKSLRAGKHTFVEKPLCTTQQELDAIKNLYNSSLTTDRLPLLMVGFNRRFSRYAREVKKHVQNRINPMFIHYRMNAGYVPKEHWIHTAEGGGRIIGEACHIFDVFSFLVDSPVKAVVVANMSPKTESLSSSDNKTFALEYQEGSVATLEYFAIGSKQLPKEYMEVHFDEKSVIIDDYRSMQGYGIQVAKIRTRTSDKGQLEELEDLSKYLKGKKEGWPIGLECLVETTEVSFKVDEQM